MGVVGIGRELRRAIGQQLPAARHLQIRHEVRDVERVEAQIARAHLGADAREHAAGGRRIVAAAHIEERILGLEGIHEFGKARGRDRRREGERSFFLGALDERRLLLRGDPPRRERQASRQQAR